MRIKQVNIGRVQRSFQILLRAEAAVARSTRSVCQDYRRKQDRPGPEPLLQEVPRLPGGTETTEGRMGRPSQCGRWARRKGPAEAWDMSSSWPGKTRGGMSQSKEHVPVPQTRDSVHGPAVHTAPRERESATGRQTEEVAEENSVHCLLGAKLCSKHFTFVNSFSHQSTYAVGPVSPFCT